MGNHATRLSMKCLGLALLGTMLTGAVARADDKARVEEMTNLIGSLGEDGTAPEHTKPFRFGFQISSALVDPDAYPEPEGVTDYMTAKKTVVAYSADKKVAWIASDMDEYGYCGDESCGHQKPYGTLHTTMLVELTTPVHPVAFHFANPMSGKDQAKAVAGGATLPALAPEVEDGAKAAVALFQGSLADPKAMAASVSKRKDVVLYGSSSGERFVGGAAVKAQLAKWGLTLTLIDGIQAGVASGGGVAWVAANLSGHAVKRPKDKPMPYRVLFIYEQTGGAWQLVQANFSFVKP